METMEKTMTVTEIANRLVELCRKGNYSGAQEELYSDDASSHEPENSPTTELKTTTGKEAIIKKENFQAMFEEVHGGSVSDLGNCR